MQSNLMGRSLAHMLNVMNRSAKEIVSSTIQNAKKNIPFQPGSYNKSDGFEFETTSPKNNENTGKGWENIPTRSAAPSENDNQHHTPDRVTFKDIVGIEHVLVEVMEIVDYLKAPEIYRKLGARMPRGILLVGPPGNGKTMLAKAIANEANCSFIQTSGSSFIEMYVGTGAARVRQLFKDARAKRPAIIFLDEFDAVAGVDRSALNGSGGDQEYKQTINELLTQLDGFSSDDSIMVIAATNNPDSLDPAVKRSGRFDRIVHVPLPDEVGRKKLLLNYLYKLPRLGLDIEEALIDQIVKDSEGLCAADFKNMVNEMAITAVRERSDFVEAKHVKAGAEKVISQRKKTDPRLGLKDIFGNKKK